MNDFQNRTSISFTIQGLGHFCAISSHRVRKGNISFVFGTILLENEKMEKGKEESKQGPFSQKHAQAI